MDKRVEKCEEIVHKTKHHNFLLFRSEMLKY